MLPCQVGEREKSLKKAFEKVFESVKELFLKNLKHDVRLNKKTGSINRTMQRLTEFFKQDFD